MPSGMALADLGKRSLARNAIVADVLSRTPYMEKLGTGINRIAKALEEAHLNKAVYHSAGFFTVILQRTPQVILPPKSSSYLMAIDRELSRADIMDKMKLSDRKNFRESYLQPDLNQGLIAMSLPDTPSSKNQKI